MDLYPAIAPVLTTAATVDVLTVEEVKAHLRVDHSDEDTLIQALRDAAVQRLDGWAGILGRCLLEQSWTASFRDFACTRLRLPLRPVLSITSVKYYDSSNVQQTFSSATYRLLADELSPYIGLVVNGQWPSGLADREDAVAVLFKAGYGTVPTAVPAPIKQAILLMIGDMYEYRETVAIGAQPFQVPMSTTVEALLRPYRAGSF